LPTPEYFGVILKSNEQAIGAETIPLEKAQPESFNNRVKDEKHIDNQPGQ
jgi:hypothetical protein